MKLLWICNKKTKKVSYLLNEPVNPFGGWLDSACQTFTKEKNNELCLMFPDKKQVHRKTENFE